MHPGPPARRGRWGRGRRREKRGGDRRQRQERGGVADSGAMGGSKGSRSRALATAPWSCTHAAAEVVVEEGTGAGGGGGGVAKASEARERRVPALRRSAGAGRQDGAAARAPRAWIPEPSLGGNGGYRARARAHPSRLSLLPASPSRPGSVPEAVRDEVPSCFPAGTALPPAPWLLLARRPKRLCLVGLWIRRGPFPRFILFSALHFIS